MASSASPAKDTPADRKRPRSIGMMLRSQMRNIAPFATLICITGFFAAASPSFATLDNFANILTQVSVTGIIAVGLTFVILCAEIDLSVAAIANVIGIAVAYFTLQDSYVNIANLPLPGCQCRQHCRMYWFVIEPHRQVIVISRIYLRLQDLHLA